MSGRLLRNTIVLLVGLKALIKMATVLVTFRLMPESPDIDLDTILEHAREIIEDFGGSLGHSQKEPVAFGLVALNISLRIDEQNSNLDPLEEKLRALDGVASAEVIDVRRAIG